MKIVICNELYAPYFLGGAERSVKILADALSQKGHQVYIYTTAPEDKEEEIGNIKIFYRKCKNIYWIYKPNNPNKIKKTIWHLIDIYNFSVEEQFQALVEQIKPDIIHTHVLSSFSPCIWKVAKKYNIPIVHTLRDYYLLCVKSTMFKNNKTCSKQCLLCKISTLPKKKLSSAVTAIIGISQFILDIHIKNGYFTKSPIQEVIFNSVPQKQNITNNINKEKVIGYIGRIHPSKGIEILLECFLQIKNLQYKLYIAGDKTTEYAQFLQKKYKHPHIQFLGLQNSEEFLSKISLLVVPSVWNEPFGRVIVEAFNSHCPVITSNRGGMPELITPHVNGDIFQIENPSSLKELLQNFNDGKICYNVDSVPPKYSIENMVSQYEILYKKLTHK